MKSQKKNEKLKKKEISKNNEKKKFSWLYNIRTQSIPRENEISKKKWKIKKKRKSQKK